MPPRTNPKLRFNLTRNPRRKLRGGAIIHRDNNHAAHRASEKCRNPFRGVLAPQHHSITLSDFARLQFPAELKCHFQNVAVGEPLPAISTMLPVGTLIAVSLKVCQEKLC